jgi:glycosyltransferase involved in cell wall biosynthesis
LAVLEAMNHGKNIIYYNSGGVMEAVGENGFFIPNFLIENTVDAILKKHQEFLTNPNTVFNKEVYDKFYNNYTPEIFAKKLKVALERNN